MTGVIVALVCFGAGFYASRRLAWRLFRFAHRNDPAALAFADREQGRCGQ